MLSDRARRIAYLEKLIALRKQEEKRLMDIIESDASLAKKTRARGYLAQLLEEMKVEFDEILALKTRS